MVIGHRQNIKVYRETDLTLIFKRWFNGVKASLSTEQSLVFIGLVQKHFMILYSKKKSKKRVNIILKKSRKKKSPSINLYSNSFILIFYRKCIKN